MGRYLIIVLTVFFLSYQTIELKAQHQEVLDKPKMWKGKTKKFYDTGAINKAFHYGVLQGHFRHYLMFTDNQPGLTDYFAQAGGGGIRFETAPYHGFQFAVSGFFIFNIQSSDLGIKDTLGNAGSRYELGLFDLENPYNRKDLDRLEEFYLKYNFSDNSNLILGRQLVNTPFINLQDGRMRPTGVEGLWFRSNELEKTQIEGGYLWDMSPRSTVRWYDVGESIGLYGSGRDINGGSSRYAGNTESHWVAMLGLHRSIGESKIHAWSFWVDNLLNSNLLQFDLGKSVGKNQVYLGLQGIQQKGMGNGGNENDSFKYVPEGHKSMVGSFRLGYKTPNWDTRVAYTRITKDGRYLMPREWGRDPFYTFMPRERNEGLGDVHAILLKVTHKLPAEHSSVSASLGHFNLPSVENVFLNKYAMTDYSQVNLDLRHDFEGVWKGLEAQVLIAYKKGWNTETASKPVIFNKVNLTQYNFVLNYHF